MTELEFLKNKGLIEEGFTEFVITGDFGKVELTKLLKEYKTEQCNIANVSQQRELLIAFLEMNNWLSLEDEENAKGVVDCYLRANNCV